MAGQLAAILSALKAGPCTVSDLAKHCASERAAVQAILRLRDAGHEIETRNAGSNHLPRVYHLRKLAGDLRSWNYPTVGDTRTLEQGCYDD